MAPHTQVPKTFLFRLDKNRISFIDSQRVPVAKNEFLLTEDQVKNLISLMYEDGPEEHFDNMVVFTPARYCPENLKKAKRYIRKVGRR